MGEPAIDPALAAIQDRIRAVQAARRPQTVQL